MSEVVYTLRMSSDMCKTLCKAAELLMRLKINQPKEITRAIMPDDYWDEETGKVDRERFGDYIRRRDIADECMKAGFLQIFPTWEDVKKDTEWCRLYNLYQAMRYQIHLAENPSGTGVDSYPPMRLTDVEMPDCSYEKRKHSGATRGRSS